MPVCIGWLTGSRDTTPEASRSIGRRSVVSIGPSLSIGSPRALTVRPISASPTGTSAARPVRETVEPSCRPSSLPSSTTPALSRFKVEHDAAHAGVELHQFAVDRAVQSVYGGDAVADLDDRTGLVTARSVVILFDLLAENG